MTNRGDFDVNVGCLLIPHLVAKEPQIAALYRSEPSDYEGISNGTGIAFYYSDSLLFS
jgi:hypothetical protein